MIAASGQLVGIATFHLIVALLISGKSRVPADAPPRVAQQARAARHVSLFLGALGLLLAAVGFAV